MGFITIHKKITIVLVVTSIMAFHKFSNMMNVTYYRYHSNCAKCKPETAFTSRRKGAGTSPIFCDQTNMAGYGKWTRIEDVFPIEHEDIPACYLSLPEGKSIIISFSVSPCLIRRGWLIFLIISPPHCLKGVVGWFFVDPTKSEAKVYSHSEIEPAFKERACSCRA